MADLSPRYQRFVQEYVQHGNGTQAAIAAGFAERSARDQASRLLRRPQIAAAIAEAKRDLRALFEAEAWDSLQALRRLRDDPEAPPSVQLGAAKDLLDRAGYKPVDRQTWDTPMQVEVQQQGNENMAGYLAVIAQMVAKDVEEAPEAASDESIPPDEEGETP